MTATATALDLETRALSWPDQARQLPVTTDEHYQLAGAKLLDIKALRKEIADTFDPIISKAHAAHKAACDEKRRHDAPLSDAESILKQGMLGYQQAQQRKAAEERARREAEQRRAEEELRLAEATALEEAGEPEQAAAVLVAPSIAPPVVVAPPVPQVKGISTKTTFKGILENKAALVKAIAAGTVPLAAVDVNNAVLQGQARMLGTELAWPGVRVVAEQSLAAGRR